MHETPERSRKTSDHAHETPERSRKTSDHVRKEPERAHKDTEQSRKGAQQVLMSARGATCAAQRLTKTAHPLTKPVDLSDKDARLLHSFEERSRNFADLARKTILNSYMSARPSAKTILASHCSGDLLDCVADRAIKTVAGTDITTAPSRAFRAAGAK